MARVGSFREAAKSVFSIFCEGGCDEVLHEIFRFPWFSVSFLAVQAAMSGENSLDTFNRFHAREMDHF